MTFIADVIIAHVRSLADLWRKQECDALQTVEVSELLSDLSPSERSRVNRAIALLSESIKAHQAAIVMDMLANDLLDLKDKLNEGVTATRQPIAAPGVEWHS